MDPINQKEAIIIEALQARFLEYNGILLTISEVFDPRYAFFLLSPLIHSFDWKIGKKLMWVIVITEWANHLLKWILHGDRPYWWIHETQIYNRTGASLPYIHQFSCTCETGPGSPSGHSQVTAAIWYTIFDSYLEKFNKNNGCIAKLCWILYLIFLIAIGTSRVFIAVHFPHQCIFGIIIGWFIAKKMRRINEKEFNAVYHCVITIGMFVSASIVYGFLKIFGSDPMWSLNRAIKWCAKSEYVRLDTTPLFSMMRYSGFLFGMGFTFNRYSQHNSRDHFNMLMKILSTFISVSICFLSEIVSLSEQNLPLFYFQVFVLNAFRACIINITPQIIASIWPNGRKVQ